MKNEVVPTKDGFSVQIKEKSIFFPQAELIQVGCRNCVWKIHGQCMHGGVVEEGICHEMIQFLASLADEDGDLSSIWEKFHIYKTRIQESEDYADFKQLEKKIRKLESEMEKEGHTDKNKEKLANLRMDKTAAKIWWAKLNQHAIMSLQKVRDRQVKAKGDTKIPGIMHAQTINFNINKQIEEKK